MVSQILVHSRDRQSRRRPHFRSPASHSPKSPLARAFPIAHRSASSKRNPQSSDAALVTITSALPPLASPPLVPSPRLASPRLLLLLLLLLLLVLLLHSPPAARSRAPRAQRLPPRHPRANSSESGQQILDPPLPSRPVLLPSPDPAVLPSLSLCPRSLYFRHPTPPRPATW
ncbi:hypothetical protein MPTK1_1g27460 [Marchantia polymorpha subsp. ruderalis]|uniref:Uncharacterized protein n=2 Tax=Marchantia polymorpha TaxID=3197 RepID=A0AAF6AUV7_MARPO|nr:hypothetical protein MARPO_0002s0132 [Marchantia polymorpha]BBN00228.1 hypothetical protein Mp_1g27460 [Marchantia polymorpha subsp. ruderalis]|eukprot:PTQ49656.1 hypothetical protein MARPO_0002s0132 [Marchantia polymorpha]